MLAIRTRHLSTDIIDFAGAGRALVSSGSTPISYDSGTGQITVTTGYTIPSSTDWSAVYAASHAAITLDAAADALLALTGQQLGMDTQTAHYALMGPTTGDPAIPTFRAIAVADLPTVTVAKGGTGRTSWTARGVIYASDASTLSQVSVGTSGGVLQTGGSGANPAFSSWTAPSAIAAGSVLAANTENTLAAVTSTSGTYVLQNAAGTISWASYTKEITTNTTLYVSTGGNDTTGDGSSGNPWATIAKALSYLNDYWISPAATVTIQLADGTYAISSAIEISHPCARQISITGQNSYSRTMSAVTATSGTAGTWTLTFQLNGVTNAAVGDYACVTGASGGANPTYAMGCHKILDVDTPNNKIQILSAHSSTAAPSGAISAVVTLLKSILAATGCHCIYIVGAQYLGSLTKVALVKAATYNGIHAGNHGGIACTAPLGIVGTGATDSGRGIYATNFAYVVCPGACISGCYIGVSGYLGSYVDVNASVISGATGSGNNGIGIWGLNHSTIYCGTATITGTGLSSGVGIYITGATYCLANSVVFTGNYVDASPAANTEGNEMSYIDT